MTYIPHPMPAALYSHSQEECTDWWSIFLPLLMPVHLVLRGIGLGLTGLAVVLAVTTVLIGVQEIGSGEPSGVFPEEIRLR